MALADRNTGTFDPFFNAENYAGYLALIFEPDAKKIKLQVPGGKFGPRDQITATVTSFKTQAALEKGEPTEVKRYTVNATGAIVRDLIEAAEADPEAALIRTVARYTPKAGGNATWVLRDTKTDADYDLAARYYANREAAVAKALDDVPPF